MVVLRLKGERADYSSRGKEKGMFEKVNAMSARLYGSE